MPKNTNLTFIDIPYNMKCVDTFGNLIEIGSIVTVTATKNSCEVKDIVYIGFQDRSLCDTRDEPGFMLELGHGLVNASDCYVQEHT